MKSKMISIYGTTKTGKTLYQCSECRIKFTSNDTDIMIKPCKTCAVMKAQEQERNNEIEELNEFWDYANDCIDTKALCREVIRLRSLLEAEQVSCENGEKI